MITIRNYMLQSHSLNILLGKTHYLLPCEHYQLIEHVENQPKLQAAWVCLFVYFILSIDLTFLLQTGIIVQMEYILSSTDFLVLQYVRKSLNRESTLQRVNIFQREKEKCSRGQSFSKSSSTLTALCACSPIFPLDLFKLQLQLLYTTLITAEDLHGC